MDTATKTDAATFALSLARTGSLWDLTAHIMSLEETAEGGIPADVKQDFEKELDAFLQGSAEKVDAYISVMDRLAEEASAAMARSGSTALVVARHDKRSARVMAQLSALRERAISVIRLRGKDTKGHWRALEGNHGRLRAVRVAPSCEVDDESMVPDDYKNVTLTHTMTAREWQEMTSVKATVTGIAPLRFNSFKVSYSTDKKRLLDALKKDCAQCKGSGEMAASLMSGDGPDAKTVCNKCNGKGTVLIPGARLVDGKLRLVVE